MFYDPMIAKLCTHAPGPRRGDRRHGRGSRSVRIEGINHNIAFLTAIMHKSASAKGALTTAFIAENSPTVLWPGARRRGMLRFVAAASPRSGPGPARQRASPAFERRSQGAA